MDEGPARAPSPAAERGTADAPEPPATTEPPAPAETARQRWRLVLARSADAPALVGRELADAFEEALEASDLPVLRPPGKARGRVAFGAPLPATMAAENELADVLMTTFVPSWLVRERLTDRLPAGWRLVDVFDVWIGAPSLAGQVGAADYRIDLGAVDAETVAGACAAVMASDALPRERVKGASTVPYDLRPLVVDVGVSDPGPPVVLRARTRFHPALGTGRPEEVVASLGDHIGQPLAVRSIVRERLILIDDLPSGQ